MIDHTEPLRCKHCYSTEIDTQLRAQQFGPMRLVTPTAVCSGCGASSVMDKSLFSYFLRWNKEHGITEEDFNNLKEEQSDD